MAATNLSISASLGASFSAIKQSDFTFGTSAPGTGDFEFRVNAVDGVNSNPIKRQQMILFLDAVKAILMSGGIYTTDLAG